MSLRSHPALDDAGPAGTGGPSAGPARPASNAARAGAEPVRAALAGKNLGLLCDDPSLEEALLAYRAAADLGAHVSLVRPRFTGVQEVLAIPETARMLGRLYDVIACVALPPHVVQALRSEAGVPVVGDVDIDARLLASATVAPSIGPLRAASAGERLAQWHEALAASLA